MDARLKQRRVRMGLAIAAAVLLVASACSGDQSSALGPLPAEVVQEVMQGGPNPPPQPLNFQNTGNCTVDFDIAVETADGAQWLSVDPSSGSLAPNESQQVGVSFDVLTTPPLTPGTYTGTITIAATCQSTGQAAKGTPAIVAANLTVTPVFGQIVVEETNITPDDLSLLDRWSAASTLGAPAARGIHTAVWTGTEMIVWGGIDSFRGSYLSSGGALEAVPNIWHPLPTEGAPEARGRHTSVWTGSAMIVWGGASDTATLNTGGVYDPGGGAWTATSTTNAPGARSRHTAVWTGSKMIVWGGTSSAGGGDYLGTGGTYDPVGDSWAATATEGAPTARSEHTAVWTGSKMIVWGSDTEPGPLGTGGIYSLSADSWVPTSTIGAPSRRRHHSAVWTGRRMIVWGGRESEGTGGYTNTGGIYDPVRDTWTPTSTVGAPSARRYHQAVWTGRRMIVWGGDAGAYPDCLRSGGIYEPATDSWAPMTESSVPVGGCETQAVWTGQQMIVWGGVAVGEVVVGTGGIYE